MRTYIYIEKKGWQGDSIVITPSSYHSYQGSSIVDICCKIALVSLLLMWINFNPSMDK